MAGKMINTILDIHTHRQEADSESKSIINYRLLEDSSFQEGCYYSVGIHPWKLTVADFDRQLDFLIRQLPNKQVVAIGETGLDKLAAAPMELQLTMFKKQVQLSEKHGLPLIIHCVRATDELLAVKKEFRPQQAWVWHGFRGNRSRRCSC